jgi:hypothetical protein
MTALPASQTSSAEKMQVANVTQSTGQMLKRRTHMPTSQPHTEPTPIVPK